MRSMDSVSCRSFVPVWKETDVLVVGGGPAGIASAVCAARHGARVVLCDQNGYLGGLSTAGLIGPFMTCYDPLMQRQVIRGFFEEFVQRMVREGGAVHPSQMETGTSYTAWRAKGHAHITPFSGETLKIVAEDMCQEAGVTLLYHAMFQEAVMRDGSIDAAVFAAKGGPLAVRARVVVDCSGDADVAFAANAPFEVGQDNNGHPQAASLFFVIDGVDREQLEAYRAEHEDISEMWFMDRVSQARARGEFPIPREKVALYESLDGTWRVNMSRLDGYDFCDPEDITRAEIDGRRQIQIIIRFLKKYIPGCEKIRLLYSAPMLGVRESRRIVGDFVLRGADMKLSARHPDDIFLSGNRFDMHVGSRVIYETTKSGDPYGVPYRVLLPRNVDNLLVAGRCVSGDQESLAAIRVIPPCFAMGQAAGTAAALCVQNSCLPSQVDTDALRVLLRQDGAYLEEEI